MGRSTLYRRHSFGRSRLGPLSVLAGDRRDDARPDPRLRRPARRTRPASVPRRRERIRAAATYRLHELEDRGDAVIRPNKGAHVTPPGLEGEGPSDRPALTLSSVRSDLTASPLTEVPVCRQPVKERSGTGRPVRARQTGESRPTRPIAATSVATIRSRRVKKTRGVKIGSSRSSRSATLLSPELAARRGLPSPRSSIYGGPIRGSTPTFETYTKPTGTLASPGSSPPSTTVLSRPRISRSRRPRIFSISRTGPRIAGDIRRILTSAVPTAVLSR